MKISRLFNIQDPFSSIVSGFAILSICPAIETLIPSIYLYALLSSIGLYYILRGFYVMRHSLKLPFGLGYKLLLLLYAIFVAIMWVRGYMIDYQYPWMSTMGAINNHFFNRTYLICWFLPLITFIPRDKINFNIAVKWSEIFAWLSIICFVIFFRKMMTSSLALATGANLETEGISYQTLGLLYTSTAFISLCSSYIPRKTWLINFSALTVSLIVLLMAGRRGASATSGAMMILSLYFWIKSKKRMVRIVLKPLMLLSCVIIVLVGMNMSAFRFIQKRGMEDTREAVDKSLLAQMNDWQMIFGKGLNGRYYHNLHLPNDEFRGWRYMTETGFYLLVLKGGYFFAFLYISLLIIPVIKGLFCSRNLLSKAFASYILLSLLELYPWGHPTFNFKFLMIWIGVSLCMSKKFRNIDNKQIKATYFNYDFNSLP